MENSSFAQQHLNLLGYHVRDLVTNYTGVVTSISFDLYGCIQAVVTPAFDSTVEPRWFDVNRLIITNGGTRAMQVPNFGSLNVAKGEQGAAEKPTQGW